MPDNGVKSDFDNLHKELIANHGKNSTQADSIIYIMKHTMMGLMGHGSMPKEIIQKHTMLAKGDKDD